MWGRRPPHSPSDPGPTVAPSLSCDNEINYNYNHNSNSNDNYNHTLVADAGDDINQAFINQASLIKPPFTQTTVNTATTLTVNNHNDNYNSSNKNDDINNNNDNIHNNNNSSNSNNHNNRINIMPLISPPAPRAA